MKYHPPRLIQNNRLWQNSNLQTQGLKSGPSFIRPHSLKLQGMLKFIYREYIQIIATNFCCNNLCWKKRSHSTSFQSSHATSVKIVVSCYVSRREFVLLFLVFKYCYCQNSTRNLDQRKNNIHPQIFESLFLTMLPLLRFGWSVTCGFNMFGGTQICNLLIFFYQIGYIWYIRQIRNTSM